MLEALLVGGIVLFVESREELFAARPHGLQAAHDGGDHAPVGGEGVVVAGGGGGIIRWHTKTS